MNKSMYGAAQAWANKSVWCENNYMHSANNYYVDVAGGAGGNSNVLTFTYRLTGSSNGGPNQNIYIYEFAWG